MIKSEESKSICVIDYGLSNLGSLGNALDLLEIPYYFARSFCDIQMLCQPLGIILPGVGAFPAGMQLLGERGFVPILNQFFGSNVPILGICLGMHMLCDYSTEGGNKINGLGYVSGSVHKLKNSDGLVPHIGWSPTAANYKEKYSNFFKNLQFDKNFYYVHSYAVTVDFSYNEMASFFHGARKVTAAISNKNVLGVQFHPEKSHNSGLRLLKDFYCNCKSVHS